MKTEYFKCTSEHLYQTSGLLSDAKESQKSHTIYWIQKKICRRGGAWRRWALVLETGSNLYVSKLAHHFFVDPINSFTHLSISGVWLLGFFYLLLDCHQVSDWWSGQHLAMRIVFVQPVYMGWSFTYGLVLSDTSQEQSWLKFIKLRKYFISQVRVHRIYPSLK